MSDQIHNTPLSVSVAFPRADYRSMNTCIRLNSGIRVESHWTRTVLGTGHAGTHVIHSTALANFEGDVNPVNVDELQDLAIRIAADWYAWRLATLEIRYESVVNWTADGFHDVEFLHGYPGITTAVSRSTWEPEHGLLRHAGEYGSSDEPPVCGAQGVQIVDGVLVNGKFDGLLLLRDNGAEVDEEDEPIWIYDWSGAEELAADAEYDGTFRGIEPGGPYILSIIDDSEGNPLDDADSWREVVGPIAPVVWDSGDDYVAGNLVSHSGSTWLAVDNPAIGDEPGVDASWLEVTLADAGGYRSASMYDTGDYVQEVRAVYAIQSSGIMEVTSSDFSLDVTNPISGVADLKVIAARGAFRLSGKVTASLASGTTNNFTTAGIANASVLIATPHSDGSTLTGINLGTLNDLDGRLLLVVNSGDQPGVSITLKDEDAGSTSQYRFALGGLDVKIPPRNACLLRYNLAGSTPDSRFRPVARPGVVSINGDHTLAQVLSSSNGTITITSVGPGQLSFVARIADGTGVFESGIVTPALTQRLGPGNKQFDKIIVHSDATVDAPAFPIVSESHDIEFTPAGIDEVPPYDRPESYDPWQIRAWWGPSTLDLVYVAIQTNSNHIPPYIVTWSDAYWILQSPLTPTDWSGATAYVIGDRIFHGSNAETATGKNAYICKAANTNETPPNATYWVLLTPAWSGATAYVVSDCVWKSGVEYRCISDHTNQVPPNATYWVVTPAPAWDSSTAYVVGDRVISGGQMWRCIADNTNETPGAGLTYWVLDYGLWNFAINYGLGNTATYFTGVHGVFGLNGIGTTWAVGTTLGDFPTDFSGLQFSITDFFDWMQHPSGTSWFGNNPNRTFPVWDDGTAYVIGDSIIHEGIVYTCTADNTNEAPPDPDFWAQDEWRVPAEGPFLLFPGCAVLKHVAVRDISTGMTGPAIRLGVTTTNIGNPLGLHFVQGVYVGGVGVVDLESDVTGSTSVANGGTGRSSLTAGQLLAGNGVSEVDSLANTRGSGEDIEVKVGTDAWIGFSSANF